MNTIYQPKFMYPKNISLDMSSPQNFTCSVSGSKITDYELIIYNNSTGSQLYTTGKINLANPIFNEETLAVNISSGTISNGLELKWTMKYWNGSESVISNEVFFMSAPDGQFKITVPVNIPSQKFTFNGNYTESASIGIKKWYYILYDSNQNEIERTKTSYSANITYEFEGFIAGETYFIKGVLENSNGVVVESIMCSFLISYSMYETKIDIDVNFNVDKQALVVDFDKLVAIVGDISGASSYENDFLYSGNKGLSLGSSSELLYTDVESTEEYTVQMVVKVPNQSSRVFFEIDYHDSVDSTLVGYDSVTTSFYKTIGEDTTSSLPLTINTSNIYLITLDKFLMVIMEFEGTDLTTLLNTLIV